MSSVKEKKSSEDTDEYGQQQEHPNHDRPVWLELGDVRPSFDQAKAQERGEQSCKAVTPGGGRFSDPGELGAQTTFDRLPTLKIIQVGRPAPWLEVHWSPTGTDSSQKAPQPVLPSGWSGWGSAQLHSKHSSSH
jgi:hypothetical protein